MTTQASFSERNYFLHCRRLEARLLQAPDEPADTRYMFENQEAFVPVQHLVAMRKAALIATSLKASSVGMEHFRIDFVIRTSINPAAIN